MLDADRPDGVRLSVADARALGEATLQRIGYPADEAAIITDQLIAMADEHHPGEPLLVPAMRGGRLVHEASLVQMRERVDSQLAALPEPLRGLDPDVEIEPYPVAWSQRCRTPGHRL